MTGTEWTAEMRAKVRDLIAQGQTANSIATVMGLTKGSILSANRRYSLGEFQSGRALGVPDDLAEVWPTMSINDLAAHYRRNRSTISRWGRLLNLPCKVSASPPPRKAKIVSFRQAGHAAPVDRPYRDDSPAGQAQQYLQQFGPVFRCNERGGASSGGRFWRRGNAVLSDADLIERADAMRRRMA